MVAAPKTGRWLRGVRESLASCVVYLGCDQQTGLLPVLGSAWGCSLQQRAQGWTWNDGFSLTDLTETVSGQKH